MYSDKLMNLSMQNLSPMFVILTVVIFAFSSETFLFEVLRYTISYTFGILYWKRNLDIQFTMSAMHRKSFVSNERFAMICIRCKLNISSKLSSLCWSGILKRALSKQYLRCHPDWVSTAFTTGGLRFPVIVMGHILKWTKVKNSNYFPSPWFFYDCHYRVFYSCVHH